MSALPPPMIPPGPIRLGLQDYLSLPDDGRCYEIIDGGLFMTPAPTTRHQKVGQRIEYALITALELSGRGQVFDAPIDVMLTPNDIVQPDIVFVRAARVHIIGDQRIDGAPDLVIEVLSPSTRRRDLTAKMALYARCGVPDYWLVDPAADRIERYKLADGAYERIALDENGAVVRPAGFEPLELDLRAVFA